MKTGTQLQKRGHNTYLSIPISGTGETMGNGNKRINVLAIICIVVGILGSIASVLAPILTSGAFVEMYTDLGSHLPRITSFYMNCPVVLYVVVGLLFSGREENYCAGVNCSFDSPASCNVCSRDFLAINRNGINAAS